MSVLAHPSRVRLLDAAMKLIRTKGYAATSIEELCTEAGLTKGGFFHHFKSKEDLAVSAAAHFAGMAEHLFEEAPYRVLPDPLLRLLGYIDFRIAILQGNLPQFTCLLGTMVQEAYQTSPSIQQACDHYISQHAAEVAKDFALAKEHYCPEADWSAESLGLYTQAVIQGSFILAKAKGGPGVAVECLKHLKRHVEMLFEFPKSEETRP